MSGRNIATTRSPCTSSRRALKSLTHLVLDQNKIGDAGLTALAGSIGALEKLVAISVDNTNHSQLKAACAKRGIKIH